MMRQIVQKGIAGIGNRLQVLGACCDLAEAVGAEVVADWRDTSFKGRLSDVFDAPTIADFDPAMEYPEIEPEWWRDKIDAPCAKRLAGDDFESGKLQDGPWKTLVICKYLASYSDKLFDLCRPNDRVKRMAELRMYGVHPCHCWHVRATDKSGDTQSIIQSIIDAPYDGLRKVVITDSADVRQALAEHAYCPSDIPPQPERGGIHHTSDDGLRACGMTRERLNLSCVADMVIAINAERFTATCPHSSYSQMIERARNNGGWRV